MNQDINKIINSVAHQFAAVQIEDKKHIAVLQEENERLKQELEALLNATTEEES